MPNISGASGEGEFQPDPVRSTASARPDLGRGTPTFDNPLDRGGGAGTVDPRAVPPPITEEQIRVMSRPELRDALHKIGQARSNRDLAPEDQARLKQEWDMIMEQLRKGGN